MNDPYKLERFIDAQEGVFPIALAELAAGAKQSHWMWFIFPQLAGLGRSPTARFYGIASIDEARAYLSHRLLGSRLGQSIETALPWGGRRSAEQIFGPVDALKFRSCLTLFDRVEPASIFAAGLKSFFGGTPDERTLALLNAWG
jgi:uncharacterized protein (DUF1810 family)